MQADLYYTYKDGSEVQMIAAAGPNPVALAYCGRLRFVFDRLGDGGYSWWRWPDGSQVSAAAGVQRVVMEACRMLTYAIFATCVVAIGILAFFIGRRLAPKAEVQSKTTTFLIKSIQAIAELAILEYITEGVTEIKEKKASILTVRWKRGLLRYTAKLKVGFDLDRLDYRVDDQARSIRIALPSPRILSCEIYNRKFYKLPLEKAENVPWKVDIIADFSSDEVLALDDEARANALNNVKEFYVLDLLRDKTRLAFKKMFALSYPDYETEIAITAEGAALTETGQAGRGRQLPAADERQNAGG